MLFTSKADVRVRQPVCPGRWARPVRLAELWWLVVTTCVAEQMWWYVRPLDRVQLRTRGQRGLGENSLGFVSSRSLDGDSCIAAHIWWYIRPLDRVQLRTSGKRGLEDNNLGLVSSKILDYNSNA